MRIKIHFSSNTEPVPFDYKELVIGTLYKWIGEKRDDFHGRKYQKLTISDLYGSKKENNHLSFPKGGYFLISSSDEELMVSACVGIMNDVSMFSGISVLNIEKIETPDFSKKSMFKTKSMIFLKDNDRFIYPNDNNFREIVRTKINNKLVYNGLPKDDTIELIPQNNFQIKKHKYKKINNKGFIGKFMLLAKPETKKFLYDNGIGSSTGIGFGCFE